MKNWLRELLADPAARGRGDLDDPATTAARQALLQSKGFLREIYLDWYRAILARIPAGPGRVVELGSGGGFCQQVYPELIRSEVFWIQNADLVLDGTALPFAPHSLKGIVMTNVLHHISRPRAFFREAWRCLRPGGSLAMVEPWSTGWSRWVYRYLHHEPFDPLAERWDFPSTGPLSGANGALPWILFKRDRQSFQAEFPGLSIEIIRPIMPFRYLLSGGLSMRGLMPAWTYPGWQTFERLLDPWAESLGMFAFIALRKADRAIGEA